MVRQYSPPSVTPYINTQPVNKKISVQIEHPDVDLSQIPLSDASDTYIPQIIDHSDNLSNITDSGDIYAPQIISQSDNLSNITDSLDTILPQIIDPSDRLSDISDSLDIILPQIIQSSHDLQDISGAGDTKVVHVDRGDVSGFQNTSDANDTIIPQVVHSTSDLSDISDSNNTVIPQIVHSTPALSDISESNNTVTQQVIHSTPALSDISESSPTFIPQVIHSTPALSDISESSPTFIPQIIHPTPRDILSDISESGDLFKSQIIQPSRAIADIDIVSSDTVDAYSRKEFKFTGRWLPAGDPLNIGEENFSVLQNMRYTNYGIECVGGWTNINTTVGKAITNGIQLKSNYSTSSYVLAQASDGTHKDIIYNTTVPPTAGDFHTYSAFAITSSANTLVFGVNGATDTTIILDISSSYTSTTLLTHILERMNNNSNLTIFGMSYAGSFDNATRKFTISRLTGSQTFHFVSSGSSAGSVIGFTGDIVYATSLTGNAVSGATSLFYEDSTAGLARFSKLPNGTVGMCDGVNNKVWAGDEQSVAACLTVPQVTVNSTMLASLYATNMADYTDRANNVSVAESDLVPFDAGLILGTSGHTITIAKSGNVVTYTDASATYVTHGLKTGAIIIISCSNFNALNNGTFTVTAVAETHFSVVNPSGVNADSGALTADGNIQTTQSQMIIGSSAPLSSVKFYIDTTNINTRVAGTMYVYTFVNGVPVSCMDTDNTAAVFGFTTTMRQTGTITITDVSPTPTLLNGYQLYFYIFSPSACDAQITNMTLNTGIHNIENLWDGIPRTATLCYVYRQWTGSTFDQVVHDYIYTLEAADESTNAAPIGIALGDLVTATDYMIVAFSERCSGFKIKMCSQKNNHAVTAATLSVSYWNGTTFQKVNGLVDGTYVGASLFRSGTVTWNNIPEAYERQNEYRGVRGYVYKLEWSATLHNYPANDVTDVIIDTFMGIPAYHTNTNIYTFPFQYQDRAMWCGSISGEEWNRVDYSPPNETDCYNGDDSSDYNNRYSLYFGNKEALTGAAELYAQYGNYVMSCGLFYKYNETYLLTGTSRTDSIAPFRIDKISGTVGCPAPLTICPIEISYANGANSADPSVNIVMWMSDKGVMMYYNHTIRPVLGIEPYFDASDVKCINTTYIASARAWYDPNYREYNLLIPSSTSATVNNVWLVYDLVRNKWFERTVPTNADFPQGAFIVSDALGNKYVYGYTASGYLIRMEYGFTCGSSTYPITPVVKSADILPSESIWDESTVYKLQTLYVADTSSLSTLAINHYVDGNLTASSANSTNTSASTRALPSTTYPQLMSNSGYRTRHLISPLYTKVLVDSTTSNVSGVRGQSHCFQWSIILNATTQKPKLLGWGILYRISREELRDKNATS